MNSKYHTKNGRTSKRGAFLNGVWHCDCDPRLPAEKFQTKNGGKNHGRWFHTCQKPQPKKCDFFLWADEAKIREESAVLSNSRSEPEPQTPKKAVNSEHPPLTPDAKDSTIGNLGTKKETNDVNHEDLFDWPSSDDEDVARAKNNQPSDHSPFETPRKAARTELSVSPGKRSHGATASSGGVAYPHLPVGSDDDDVFVTPRTSTESHFGLLSPARTPGQVRSQAKTIPSTSGSEPSNLVSDVLKILRSTDLKPDVERELVDLLNLYHLRTQGIAKGRDIARLAIQAKEKRISELQARIAGLEVERETSKNVIAHLKQDIATTSSSTSPTKKRFHQ